MDFPSHKTSESLFSDSFLEEVYQQEKKTDEVIIELFYEWQSQYGISDDRLLGPEEYENFLNYATEEFRKRADTMLDDISGQEEQRIFEPEDEDSEEI